MGLNNLWICGAGRTGQTKGQSNLFPDEASTPLRIEKKYGSLININPRKTNFSVTGKGSCVGVLNQIKRVRLLLNDSTQNICAFEVIDSSANGKRWIVNTPEWNNVKKIPNGYELKGPDDQKLMVLFPPNEILKIDVDTCFYGGEKQQHNLGYWYRGKNYSYSKTIIAHGDRIFHACLILMPAKTQKPSIRWNAITKSWVVK